MITCDEFMAEFGDYLSDRVSPEVREQLKLHLSQCRTCEVLDAFHAENSKNRDGQRVVRFAAGHFGRNRR